MPEPKIPDEIRLVNEQWKWYIPGRYAISDQGRWWSGIRKRILAGSLNSFGYHQVSIWVGRKMAVVHTHRIGVSLFTGEIPRGKCVNHINGNKADNRICNLEIVTPKENAAHAQRMGLIAYGVKQGTAKLDDDKVKQILSSPLSGVEIGKSMGVSKGIVSKIRRGDLWRHIPRPSYLGRALGPLRGIDCLWAKLTESQVRQIKDSSNSARNLASQYGVSDSCIYLIRNGSRWKHVL